MTMPANLPSKFRQAAHDFADKLRASFASGMPAQPEDQLKGPVQALLAAVTSGVLTKTEAQVHDLGGRPDIGVEVRNALCGFVELKAPGLGAQTKKLKDRDKRQWEKFSALPNILYTDALEWALYHNRLRLSYGVVYTPQEIIGCQVALVSELLADRFGKHLTFADEGGVSLDSSTGTAACVLDFTPSLHE